MYNAITWCAVGGYEEGGGERYQSSRGSARQSQHYLVNYDPTHVVRTIVRLGTGGQEKNQQTMQQSKPPENCMMMLSSIIKTEGQCGGNRNAQVTSLAPHRL